MDTPFETGQFKHVYCPVHHGEVWWLNDQSFIRDRTGTWHLFSITMKQPEDPIAARMLDDDQWHAMSADERKHFQILREERQARIRNGTFTPFNPLNERHLDHATAPDLHGPWTRQDFALTSDSSVGEHQLWAPFVIEHNSHYYLFYCAGGENPETYQINLATSPDLFRWTRHKHNPLFRDGYQARDPMILRLPDRWLMYYTATSEPSGGNHIVAFRESKDLINWGPRNIAFKDSERGKEGGTTESPFVLRRGRYYYLFISMRKGYQPGCYRCTDVFRSTDPRKWSIASKVGAISAHAPEIVRDVDGRWYASHTGWWQGGTWLAPIHWNDGECEHDTSLPEPRC